MRLSEAHREKEETETNSMNSGRRRRTIGISRPESARVCRKERRSRSSFEGGIVKQRQRECETERLQKVKAFLFLIS